MCDNKIIIDSQNYKVFETENGFFVYFIQSKILFSFSDLEKFKIYEILNQ